MVYDVCCKQVFANVRYKKLILNMSRTEKYFKNIIQLYSGLFKS